MPPQDESIAQASKAEAAAGPTLQSEAREPGFRDSPARKGMPAESEFVAADAAVESQDISTMEALEDAPMLDVHPPHEGIHSWKQYLLHMSTIVLGLLIAIGLEQSVEAMHRAHERKELRESLAVDTEHAIRDAKSAEDAETPSIDWLNARRTLIEEALATHKSFAAPLPRAPHVDSVTPGDPVWNAAKSSGLLPLLTQDEVEVYSYADKLIEASQNAFVEGLDAAKRRGQFEFTHSIGNAHQMDLSRATPEELERYRELLADEGTAWNQYRVLCQYVRGVETAIGEGERDIDKVQQAKTRFYKVAPR